MIQLISFRIRPGAPTVLTINFPLFSIKDLRKFTDEIYVELKHAYTDLNKKKDAYDFARHKLKNCKPDQVEERGQAAQKAQKDFEHQANLMYDLLQKLPNHEMMLAKAFYTYARAESDYTREVHDVVRVLPSPAKKSANSKSVRQSLKR